MPRNQVKSLATKICLSKKARPWAATLIASLFAFTYTLCSPKIPANFHYFPKDKLWQKPVCLCFRRAINLKKIKISWPAPDMDTLLNVK